MHDYCYEGDNGGHKIHVVVTDDGVAVDGIMFTYTTDHVRVRMEYHNPPTECAPADNGGDFGMWEEIPEEAVEEIERLISDIVSSDRPTHCQSQGVCPEAIPEETVEEIERLISDDVSPDGSECRDVCP